MMYITYKLSHCLLLFFISSLLCMRVVPYVPHYKMDQGIERVNLGYNQHQLLLQVHIVNITPLLCRIKVSWHIPHHLQYTPS